MFTCLAAAGGSWSQEMQVGGHLVYTQIAGGIFSFGMTMCVCVSVMTVIDEACNTPPRDTGAKATDRRARNKFGLCFIVCRARLVLGWATRA